LGTLSKISFSAENEMRENYEQTSKIEHENGDITVIVSSDSGHIVVRSDSEGSIKNKWFGKSGGMTHAEVVKREQFPNLPKLVKAPKDNKHIKKIKVTKDHKQ